MLQIISAIAPPLSFQFLHFSYNCTLFIFSSIILLCLFLLQLFLHTDKYFCSVFPNFKLSTKAYSEPSQISKMERFVKIVNTDKLNTPLRPIQGLNTLLEYGYFKANGHKIAKTQVKSRGNIYLSKMAFIETIESLSKQFMLK